MLVTVPCEWVCSVAICVSVGGVLESDLGASLFHAPSRETVFTSTSTLGHKPFLFIPQQVSPPAVRMCVVGEWVCVCSG